MNAARRKQIAKVQLEKQRLAAGVTEAELNEPVKSTLVFSKHFMIEPQGDEEGEDVYAVYRLTDMLSSVVSESAETPGPVHVCDLAIDAGVLANVLDMYVDSVDSDSPTLGELRLAADANDQELVNDGSFKRCDHCGKVYGADTHVCSSVIGEATQ